MSTTIHDLLNSSVAGAGKHRRDGVGTTSRMAWICVAVTCLGLVSSGAALADEPAPDASPPAETPTEEPPTDEAAPPEGSLPGASELDDAIELLEPVRSRGKLDLDRLEARSLFAAGRMKEQQEDATGALRLYQRALRYDPQALPIVREIVRLAFELDRSAEAVRYALRAVELDPSDPLWLRQLGVVLTEQGDLASALALYQKALALETDKASASHVMLTLEAGKLYYLTEQPQPAADAFAEVMAALDKPEENGLDDMLRKAVLADAGQTYQLFAAAFLAADRPDLAQAAFDKVEELAPNKSLHAWHLAQVHAVRKEPAKALTQLQEYFDAHDASQNQAPYQLLSGLLVDTGEQAELLPRLEKLRQADPGNAPLRLYLADQYKAADMLDQAEPLYAESVKQAPTTEAYQGLVAIYRQKRKTDLLLEALGEAAAKSGGLEVLGTEFKALVGDAELLTALFAAAREQHQKDADSLGYGARLAMALLALSGKQFEAADEFFSLALKIKREDAAELLLTWGLGLLGEERYAEAAAVLQRGIDERVLPADNPAFHFYLSGALVMQDKTDEALAAARAAASMGAKSARLESRIPWILYHAKRYDEATQSYREFLVKFEGEHKSEEVRRELRQARLVLSNICVIQDNLPLAEEYLEQVLDEYPEDVSAMNDLGYLWADQGKHLSRAAEMIQRAVAAEPDNAAYRDSLGWAYYKLERYDEAVVELEKAAAGESPDGVILEHLADAYLKQDKVDLARATWQRALASFEKEQDASKAQRVKDKLAAHPEGGK